jgi:two-component system, OmpR family, phosphate regulon response regulator OmpR
MVIQQSRAFNMYAQWPHLLVVDDDDRIRDLLSRYLTGAEYVVATARSAEDASELLQALKFDLLVVDIMLPGLSGVDMTRTLRRAETNSDVPVLLLTAMGDTQDRINGLEAGADDYLAKPFEPRELLLRIQAILRRRPSATTTRPQFSLGPWAIDLDREELRGEDGLSQKLTPVELKLIRALTQKPGTVMSRDELAALCGVDPDERTIDVQITRLRRKLGDDSKDPKYIETVRGQGYRIIIESYEIK